jgi:tyrosinase
MKRRSFLASAAAIAAYLCVQRVRAATFSQPLLTRRNVTSASALTDIETLKEGVRILAANGNAEQYTSWMYWANSHGTPDPIPTSMERVWYRCEHGSMHFLSWHRAYLYYFEELIRQITKNADFALPYWNWYAGSEIPQAFATTANNTLHHVPRNYVKRALLRDALSASTFRGFSSLLEGNPHGTVHVMVGGDMGGIDTSARDPLFWAHHANVDRLWEVWRAKDPARHQNPSDEAWLMRSFVFDLAGEKTLRAGQLFDTSSLGYVYDSVSEQEAGVTVPPRPTKVIRVAANAEESGASGDAPRVLGRAKEVVLSDESVSFRFEIGQSDRVRLSAVPESSSPKPPDVYVRLRDIKLTTHGRLHGFEFRLYVNLPNGVAGGVPHEAFYVGSINSFQLSGKHSHDLRFSLQDIAGKQASLDLWSNTEVLFSVLSTQPAEEPLVSIGAAELVLGS